MHQKPHVTPRCPYSQCALLLILILTPAPHAFAQSPAAPKPDPLGRDNPQSAVTGFLLACHDKDYQQASQFLDLRRLPAANRASRAVELARDLEAILNSSPDFNVLHLSRNPQGNLADDNGAAREHVVSVTHNGQAFSIDLDRVSSAPNAPPVWLFSSDTATAIPQLTPSAAPPAIARYLPRFLVNDAIVETPLWKWLALLLAIVILFSLGGLFDHLLRSAMRFAGARLSADGRIPVAEVAIAPARVILSLAVFQTVLQFINPSAIARLYVGRALELIFVSAVAWFLMKLVELLLAHVEGVLDPRHHYGSRSMLHLARRAANVTIIVLATLLILSNWGYNTATLVAGLGVGGIAVALAAQQTIANVFGGVSVIGDQPVRIGDFGKFGDLTGTVEDIGMRSTRIRTPGRTVVSVPNSSFAALNIENYSLRDKMLFNTILPIKRDTPQDHVQHLLEALQQKLASHKSVEPRHAMVRVTGLTSAAVNVEVFCYLRTADWDDFYVAQGELLLDINEVLKAAGVELA